ncbi:hypothetical protein JG688_00001816 [Phytophthora aleatoria]|uniref:Uncharacterized protein n=1 Tax=Phytophthora aleatoria TaxID=2496075 RepID=A0A8J5MB73_9STRA|nr:hypothetical protein JG688_00001816 [Phytophthora aleatoria]
MIVRHDRRLMARTQKAAQSKAKIAEQATASVVGLAGGMPQGIQGSYPVEDSRPRGDQHFPSKCGSSPSGPIPRMP